MKKRLTNPTFDASAQTVVHASFSDVTLAGIQLIVNVTDQIIIYNFADTTRGGTLSTDTLTLEYDTTSMSDTDELMVLVDDGAATTAVSGTVDLGATDNAVLDDIASKLGTIDADTGGILTSVQTLDNAISGNELQVDVLTMPTTTVQATNLDIRDLVNTDVVTAELSATDNAVLDTIAAKDFATQTTLAAINAKLVTGTDIGDVTINNSTGAAAVNIQDGGNTITVDGTVAVTNAGITTIAGAVSGTEMQVDVLTMPTVTVTATNFEELFDKALRVLKAYGPKSTRNKSEDSTEQGE